MVSTEQWFGSLLSKHYIVLEPSRHNRVLFILRRRRFTRGPRRRLSPRPSTALAEHDAAAAEACREFARQNTWERHGEQLAKVLS
jgi:hypothetical protein